MATEGEKIAALEVEMREVRSDVGEIKTSIKSLEKIAAQGGGALHTILIIGGFIGWLAGIGTALYAIFHK
jgi:prefoldin subunit 5